MPLQARTEYGCLAMLELTRNYAQGETIQIRRIAEEHGIPQPFLLQVMQQLKRSGMVVSARGASGGYRMARDPVEISLADVIDAFEGERQEKNSDPAVSPYRQLLQSIYTEAESAKREVLASTSLDDLSHCVSCHAEPIWHI